MATRARIARINRDGTGRHIYLGHGSHPDQAGAMLLRHYQDPADIDALIAKGAIPRLFATPDTTGSYHQLYNHPWEQCQPVAIQHGTDELFGYPYLPGPDWLYAWTPDGWLAAKVQANPPASYRSRVLTLPPDEFEHWFDHNTEPEWVAWRARAIRNQRPRPLAHVIDQYTDAHRS